MGLWELAMHFKMKFSHAAILIATFVLTFGNSNAFAQRGFSDKRIDANIKKMQKYLFSRISATGKVNSNSYRQQGQGAQALVAYSLIKSGISPDNLKVAAIIKRISSKNSTTNYAAAMKIKLFSLLGDSYKTHMSAEVRRLLNNQKQNGGWSNLSNQSANIIDSANVIDALYIAYVAGVKIPVNVWLNALKFVESTDNGKMQFGYQSKNEPKRFKSDTCNYFKAAAGLIYSRVLAVQIRNRFSKRKIHLLEDKYIEILTRNHIDLQNVNHIAGWVWGDQPKYSYLNMLAQCTEFCDPMRINRVNLDACAVLSVRNDISARGSLPGNIAEDKTIATAYGLILLFKARQPVTFTVLKVKNISPELAVIMQNQCDYLGKKLGKPCTWRSYSLNSSQSYFNQGAILVIPFDGSGIDKYKIKRVRHCLQYQIPTIILSFKTIQASSLNSVIYNLGIGTFNNVSPNSEIMNLPIELKPIKFSRATKDGKFIIFLPQDVTLKYRLGYNKATANVFDLQVNILSKVNLPDWPTWKYTPVKRKMLVSKKTNYDSAKKSQPIAIFEVIQVTQNSKTSKVLFNQLNKDIMNAVSIGVTYSVKSKIKKIAKVNPNEIIWEVTGIDRAKLLDDPESLKAYLEKGGTAIIEYQGNKSIANIYKKVEKIAGRKAIKYITADHELLTGKFLPNVACNISKLKFNPAQAKKAKSKNGSPLLIAVMIKGRPALILSPMSITASAAGKTRSRRSKILGYDIQSARKLAYNLLLYANNNLKKKNASMVKRVSR